MLAKVQASRDRPVTGELPNNVQAEQAVLGSILIDPESYYDVSFLTANDFWKDGHRILFDVMLKMIDAGEAPDLITVCNALELQGRINEAQGYDAMHVFLEGNAYIACLSTIAVTSNNVAHYGRIVQNLSECRSKIADAAKLVDSAYKGNVVEARAYAETLASGTVVSSVTDLSRTDAMVNDFLDELNELSLSNGAITGLSTGYRDLDHTLCGLNRSDLLILAARPAIGKSTFALNIAKNVAMAKNIPMQERKGVVYFSLEMGKQQVLRRLVSDLAGIDLNILKTGRLDDEHWERLSWALAQLENVPLYLDDTAGISCNEIRNKVKRLMAQQEVGLIVVDYLQLMSGAIQNKGNREQDVSFISRSLKNLAREFDIPIIALSQLSRAVENRQNKVPQLSDLRESGSLEQDSDIVMFIYRDDVYNPDSERKNIADIHIAKHRNGPTGEVSLFFNGALCRFKDLEMTAEA